MSVYMRYLHQESKIRCCELVKRYPQYAPRSIYRHAQKPVDSSVQDRRKYNRGRQKKLSVYDERMISRTVFKLRDELI